MAYLCSMTCSVIKYSNTSFITVRFEKCLNNWIWCSSWQSNSRWGHKVIYDFLQNFNFWRVNNLLHRLNSLILFTKALNLTLRLFCNRYSFTSLFFLLFWPLLPTLCRYREVIVGPGHNHWHKHTRTHTHTHTHTHTLSRIPLDEGQARRRDLYLTTQNIHNRETSLIPAGFELANPRSKQLLI